jgi:hypothetical protein
LTSAQLKEMNEWLYVMSEMMCKRMSFSWRPRKWFGMKEMRIKVDNNNVAV